MKLSQVILKAGKEKSIAINRHPWIFSGAIEKFPKIQTGDLADVYSHQGQFLARAYFHTENSIAGRIISFSQDDPSKIIESKIQDAFSLRQKCIPSDTNCFRLINAESDGLPGLIVDKYDDVFVMQVNTAGMEKLKPIVIQTLRDLFKPRSLFEKSVSSARAQEGLEPFQGFHLGEPVDEVLVEESGIQFFVSLTEGQKTGLFLDHRQMRQLIGSLSKNKKVINCFSYTGGFSLYALRGGASLVTSVDISESACRYAHKNTHQNLFPSDSHQIICADVFEFLKEKDLSEYDVIIIDPPAFAKKRKDIDSATIGYRRLNTTVLARAKPGTIILTSSCSYFIDKQMFQHIVFQAGAEAKRDIRIIQNHILSADHPISLFHPEGEYLKSLMLYVGN
jgi:23S rRNA (cytosine1962-C5)-methyltransferase